MADRPIPINVRSDQPHGDWVTRQLTGLHGERCTQFLHTLRRMSDNKIPPADCAEVLNARYETYPIKLGDGGMVLLADLNSVSGGWTLLDILMVGTVDSVTLKQGRSLEIAEVGRADVPARLYDACCTAHGLIAPTREPHWDRRR